MRVTREVADRVLERLDAGLEVALMLEGLTDEEASEYAARGLTDVAAGRSSLAAELWRAASAERARTELDAVRSLRDIAATGSATARARAAVELLTRGAGRERWASLRDELFARKGLESFLDQVLPRMSTGARRELIDVIRTESGRMFTDPRLDDEDPTS